MRAFTSAADDAQDRFEMANLSPALTGLPMIVWISERGRARHDARQSPAGARPPCTAGPHGLGLGATHGRCGGRTGARPAGPRARASVIELNLDAIIAYGRAIC